MLLRPNTLRLILFLTGASAFQTGLCQENFLSGYMIQRGDTINGFIDYRNWHRNPEVIRFKEGGDANIIEFRPFDIDRFSVADELYESAVVLTDVSPGPLHTDGKNIGADGKLEADTTFLQTLVRGERSLYLLVNRINKFQFYINQDDKFQLLVYTRYLSAQGSERRIAENKSYMNQLAAYLGDCATIQSQMDNLEYDQKSMEKLFRAYYDCTRSKPQFGKQREKIKVQFGAIAGVSVTSLDVRGVPYLEHAETDPSIDFSGGLFLELVLPRNQRKWSLNSELLYSSYNIRMRYNDYTSENRYTIYRSTLGYSYVKLNSMVRYKYRVGNLFLFINAGISNGMAIREVNSVVRDVKFYSSERVEYDKAMPVTRKYEQGYLFGAGAKLRDLTLEVRLQKGNGMSDVPRLRTSSTQYSLLFGYKM